MSFDSERRFVAKLALAAVAAFVATAVRADKFGSAPREASDTLGVRSGAAAAVHASPGKLTPPVDLEWEIPEPSIAPGALITLQARVTARTALETVHIDLDAAGAAQIVGPASLDLGDLATGEATAFDVQVRYTDLQRSEVHARIRAQAAGTTGEIARDRAVYTLFHRGRALAGTGGFLLLEQRAVQQDIDTGLLTPEQARERLRELRTLPGTVDETPRVPKTRTPQEQRMSEAFEPWISLNEKPRQTEPFLLGGTITVQGTVRWTDENGMTHPAYGFTVEVRDDETIGSELVAIAATGSDGAYSFVVDNDDGIGAGNRDIFVRVLTANAQVRTVDTSGDPYERQSPVHNEVPDGSTVTENFTFANSGTGPAGSVQTGGSYIAWYSSTLNGGSFLPGFPIEWPGASTATSFYTGSKINLLELDRWDWDVFHHEWGHYVMDFFDIENNPGGSHGGQCLSDARGSKDVGIRLAWGEGWPTYFAVSGQQELNLTSLNVPRVGDVSYQDTEDASISYSLETQGGAGQMGEDNENAVQRLLWDLFDTPADSRDNVDVTDLSLFNPVNGADPVNFSQAWAALRNGLSNAQDLAYGAVATDHGMAPSLVGPTAGTIVGPSNANFSWNPGVGCSSTFDGNSFDLVFYHAGTLAEILTISGLTSTTTSLTTAQLGTLIAATHNVRWAVEGRNTNSPATGPYLSENFTITLNRPPVANAGPDQPAVECTSPTTTAVALNGTGSSDPDGDTLSFTWSAPGVVLDDPHSPTPTGQFPMGTTVVTLVVSDGFETDDDHVSITVRDTTPPVITCPADVVVECSSHGGTPADDPQLAAFFGSVSATDMCDTSPQIADDAPAFFQLGFTPVTFTATDHSGNSDSCTANVEVRDTTPPTLEVVLNRNVLWPPNHKLALISAAVTVTDICDPDPTFVLTSIKSDEPEDGLGDGHTKFDIQTADYGTADLEFQLRSERLGGEDGRIYTILYTASDHSGNTTADTTYVRVPHDQSGHANTVSGFLPDGSALDPGAVTFRLAVLSSEGFDAQRIDPAHVYIGNQEGVIAPQVVRLANLDGNASMDLDVVAPAQPLRSLISQARSQPVGLHYVLGGTDFLVGDLFALGAPIVVRERAAGRDRQTAVDGARPTNDDTVEPPADRLPGQQTGTSSRAAVHGEAAMSGGDHEGRRGITLSSRGHVNVQVFDVLGRKVRTLVDGEFAGGWMPLEWNGHDDRGRRVASGVYFFRIDAPGVHQVQRTALVR